METFNVELKLTVGEAEKIAEIVKFNVSVQQELIRHHEERIAEADDGHGNPKGYHEGRLREVLDLRDQIVYLLGVINIAINDAKERNSEPF